MIKRKVLKIGIVSITAVALAGFVTFYLFREAINEWNLSRIRDGMTQADVERVLGGPASRVENVRYHPRTIDPAGRADVIITSSHSWVGDTMTIRVGFLEDGTVGHVQSYEHKMTFARRVRHWLRLERPAVGGYLDVGSTTEIIPD